ncbi:MAG: hypothetical protein ACLQQ4_02920 [Bacteroidia bacterium]
MNLFFSNNKLLITLQIILFALLVSLICYAFYGRRYYIAEPDEATYYNAARLFSETNSVSAGVATEEGVSPVWHCNWYGPMYHIFYGVIAKIAGFHIYNFLIVNILCVLGTIVLVYRSKFQLQTKFLISTAFLSLYVFIVYIFQFYPEPLHLFFDTILILTLKRISDNDLAGKPYKKDLLLYIFLVIFFSLFRVTTVFWIFGLLAFARTMKGLLKMCGICLAALLFIMLYMHYFNAPYTAGILADIERGNISFNEFIKASFQNIFYYFTGHNSFYDLLYLVLIGMGIFNYAITKNRLILSACIISILSLFVLLILYTTDNAFLDKQTAYFYPLLLIPIFYAGLPNTKKAVIALLLFFAPVTYIKAFSQIKLRKDNYIVNEKLQPLCTQIEQLKNKIEPGKPMTILYKMGDIDKIPYIYFLSHLPVSTTDNFPITYSVNIYFSHPMDEIPYNDRFKTQGKYYIDYFLSGKPLTIDSSTLVEQNEVFYLYKNNKKLK